MVIDEEGLRKRKRAKEMIRQEAISGNAQMYKCYTNYSFKRDTKGNFYLISTSLQKMISDEFYMRP